MAATSANPGSNNYAGRRQSRAPRKSSLAKTGLLHTRLSVQGQGIASSMYTKAMEFSADGPGRVIVRLERLMGSDRIRITDTKYMATLLQRLQEAEEITLQKRTRERRKAEHNRFRQLVIDGYTEPTPAMEDLCNHPVFRVNRILNRLNRLNANVTPAVNLPPIIAVDPFQNDDTGRVFKSYPGHYSLAQGSGARRFMGNMKPRQVPPVSGQYSPKEIEKVPNLGKEMLKGRYESEDGKTDVEGSEQEEFVSKVMEPTNETLHTMTTTSSVDKNTGHNLSISSKEKHSSHITFARTASSTDINDGSNSGPSTKIGKQHGVDDESSTYGLKTLTLQEIQRKYGVATNTDLGTQWKPYRSPIVETLFQDEQRGVWDLYEMGRDIVSMYDRQHQTTDVYIESLLQSKNGGKNQGLRSSKSMKDDNGKKREENDGIGNEDGDVPPLTEMGDYVGEQEETESDNEFTFEPLFGEGTTKLETPTWENFDDEMWNEELHDRKSSVPQEDYDVLQLDE